MSASIEGIAEIFRVQAGYCQQLGSPFTARLCLLVAKRMDWLGTRLGQHMVNWPGNAGVKSDVVPLRLCGALNHLALTGQCGELASHYPPNGNADKRDDDALWRLVSTAMEDHFEAIAKFMQSAPQTNEIRRSVALIPCYHLLAKRFAMPLVIRELGASAGLNLVNDRFLLKADGKEFGPKDSKVILKPDWQGDGPMPSDRLRISSAIGCDLAPIDCSNEDERIRLLSYIWPDQRLRVENTIKAIELQQDQGGAQVEKMDAIDWLENRLQQAEPGSVTVVQHTIAWQYFPKDVQEKGEALFAKHVSRASAEAPIARIAMEAGDNPQGANLSLTTWPGAKVEDLALVDFHGRWIKWH